MKLIEGADEGCKGANEGHGTYMTADSDGGSYEVLFSSEALNRLGMNSLTSRSKLSF